MIAFTVKLADIPIGIRVFSPSTQSLMRGYYSEEQPVFTVTVTKDDLIQEREFERQVRAVEGLPILKDSLARLERLALHRKLAEELIYQDVLLFHGSVIAVDGEAYLFAAKSGTGKSTHSRLWREAFGDRAVMINDDKPFLRIGEDGVLAYGTPWNGKHHLGCNSSAPLKTFCVLTRDSSNHIEPISPEDAFSSVYRQCFHPADEKGMKKVLDLLERMSKTVRFYHLGCNMDPEAALVSYRGMQEEQ